MTSGRRVPGWSQEDVLGSRAGLRVCGPGGPAPGAEFERRLRGSPLHEAWDGATAAPLTLRVCPVVSKHSSVPDLEPFWWGLGPQTATVRTGVAVASIPRSSVAVRGPA